MFSKTCQIRPISISLSPNTEKDDVVLAFKLLFQPWRWKWGKEIEKLEEEFRNYLGVKYAISFNSGRSSLLAILNCLEFEKGSEILLQAFTCNAVPNPVIWAGLKPVYVDCNDDFNIDIQDLKEKINPKTRAVIVQHTFGNPADMDEIVAICKENNLLLIEDCAHALGAEYRGQKVGTMGDVSFFSFSRDKVISSVYGGMVATNNDNLAQKLRDYQKGIGYPSFFWIKQQLLHPVLMDWIILPTYKHIGKYIFVLLQELNILSKAVNLKEKKGERPNYFPKRLPNAQALLALSQFKKLDKFNNYRKEMADFYRGELKGTSFELPKQYNDRSPNYLRLTIKHLKAHEIIEKVWKKNLLIGDWYTTAIAPDYNKLEKVKHGKGLRSISENMGYKSGSCPTAEKLAKITLNLPTQINISRQDAQKVINFLKQWK